MGGRVVKVLEDEPFWDWDKRLDSLEPGLKKMHVKGDSQQ